MRHSLFLIPYFVIVLVYFFAASHSLYAVFLLSVLHGWVYLKGTQEDNERYAFGYKVTLFAVLFMEIAKGTVWFETTWVFLLFFGMYFYHRWKGLFKHEGSVSLAESYLIYALTPIGVYATLPLVTSGMIADALFVILNMTVFSMFVRRDRPIGVWAVFIAGQGVILLLSLIWNTFQFVYIPMVLYIICISISLQIRRE
ncbi:hypothetical protein IMZ31_21255 (plasmid) [Pontibacillus sp. ALD_SL1]|uniref:hypothetical protein n=1 Tax=Pontibacillus sp. ALD_SL1 TaxID=2777185 RepID=UPI001A96C557|nr:hypothetical protein [Pontibacillus sp. ALD_SL1]QST03079.1 hypothetical protein IMZ31_21255 [Pontibacillus sp. ALD_SL1]